MKKMPWMIEKSDKCPASRPYAVIKEADGSVEGCHATEADAEDQVVALYASEEEQREVSLKPTAGMASAAKRGLRLHEEGKSGDGLKPETVRRAKKLANREEMNRDWVVEMNAWFARHASDKKPGWDKPGSETPGFVAFLLWGGSAAKEFSARKVAQLEKDRSFIMEMERRDIEFQDDDELVVEQRSDGTPVIRGYAVTYNRLSVPLGGFRERILPGAFDDVLNRKQDRVDLVSYFNHDANIMLGRESSGTLRVWSDDRGVGFEVTPPKTRADILELIARKDVRGASFTFALSGPESENWVEENGMPIREVRTAKIYELGPVVQPAYPSTAVSVAMRSLEAWRAEQQAIEVPEIQQCRQMPSALAKLKAAILRSL
jgi:hypothetical protein